MKCPRCTHLITDREESCAQCGFHIGDLGQSLTVPDRPRGYVLDLAHIIDPHYLTQIEERCQECYALTEAEPRVVTVPNTSPITPAQYVFWLFNQWGVGGDTNRGFMILLARGEHRIECEVGYDLEHLVSDEESGAVLDELVVPYLQQEEYGRGLYHGLAALATLIEGRRT